MRTPLAGTGTKAGLLGLGVLTRKGELGCLVQESQGAMMWSGGQLGSGGQSREL